MPEPADDTSILIVDDNPANLDLLAQILRTRGYRTRAVPSGAMAIESIRLAPPDLVLLDIKMPGMDGYETCQAIKADPDLREIPVIFISALDDAWDKVRAFQVGGVDYLTKPLYAEEVLVRVRHQVLLQRMKQELVAHARSLEDANMKLLEMDRMKERFTAMLVHDLRSPLTAISTAMTMIEEERQIPIGQVIQLAKRSLQNIFDMINDLMEVFRTSGSELRIDLEPVRIASIVQWTCEERKPEAARKEIRLELELPPSMPEVQADMALVERMLGNLLGNAIKFTSSGGSVRVTAEEERGSGVEQHQRWLALRVKDTGRGIPPDKLPFIFDPFMQVMRQDTGLGFGLGLAIVQRIMAAHKGRVTVQSQEGVGSTFSLLFPLPAED
ncbi:MAG TPA: hybrid sensor histidine kinase/response regulator [Holophaga sp.]|nr:hybrid sensor histidine kinase/response regulator [Holophaga sp.]